MDIRRWRHPFLPVVIVALVVAGCAKRPSSIQASAPAPSGSASAGVGTSEEPGPSGAAPSGSQEIAQSGATGGGTTVTPPARVEPSRPAEPRATPTAESPAPAPGPTVTEPSAPAPAAGPTAMEPSAPAPPGEQMIAAARPLPKEYAAVAKLPDIHFDFDKYKIRPDAEKILDANAEWLRSNPNYLLLIEGHCDERGTNEYNLALGQHRAKATRDYLLAQGVQASRITTISYGKERPLCIERTERCWAKNRRAHFLVKAQ